MTKKTSRIASLQFLKLIKTTFRDKLKGVSVKFENYQFTNDKLSNLLICFTAVSKLYFLKFFVARL